MGFVKRMVLRAAVLAGAGYAGYRLLLDDAARENVRRAASELGKVASEVAERAYDAAGLDMTEPAAERASGKEAIREQWESLGY